VRRPTERCSRRGRPWTLRPPRRPTTAPQAAAAGAVGSHRTRRRRPPAVTRDHQTAADWPRCARWAGRRRRVRNRGDPPLGKGHLGRNEYPRSRTCPRPLGARGRYSPGQPSRRRHNTGRDFRSCARTRPHPLECGLPSLRRPSRYRPGHGPIRPCGPRRGTSSLSPLRKLSERSPVPDSRSSALRVPYRLPRPSTGPHSPTAAPRGLTATQARL
jgi:hypothetical protein